MTIYQVTNPDSIAPLFANWDETLIWSYLDGCMGKAYTDNLDQPTSAQIVIGDFCFYAGVVNDELIRNNLDFSFDVIPQNHEWEKTIERIYQDQVVRRMRYATKKEPDVFNTGKLQEIVDGLAAPYECRQINGPLYDQIMASDWAADLCANFDDCEDFLKNGLGFVILKKAELVAGASSYTFYKNGIEIEIDTRADERRKGLASVCGAKLILACLERNLYPSWDAHNLGSLALSEKLGYHFDKEYPTYEFVSI